MKEEKSEYKKNSYHKQVNLEDEAYHFGIDSLLKGETQLDRANDSQEFYKIYSRLSTQVITKMGFKLFRVNQEQENLALFCLSLLQFQVKAPLKLIAFDKTFLNNGQIQNFKEYWLQIKFLGSPQTKPEDEASMDWKFQKKIYLFFTQIVIPALCQFKSEKISWEYMASKNYTDEKVIEEFKDTILKKINDQYLKIIS